MSKALNELKKATMAAYLAKAGGHVRAGTSIAKSFDDDVFHHMKVVNQHSPFNVHNGVEKDPEKLAHATKQMNVNAELRDQFKRGAQNRIKGIGRAGRLLAKEQAEQIDELKKSTLGSYLKKAANRHGETAANIGALAGAAAVVAPGATLSQDELEDHLGKKAMRQSVTGAKGMGRAINRLTKEEAVNELDKKTLGSYVLKASNDQVARSAMSTAKVAAKNITGGRSLTDKEIVKTIGKKEMRKMKTRSSGMTRAVSRLASEEVVNEAGKNPYGPGYKLVDKDGTELKVGHKFMHTSHHEGSKPEHHEITGWQSGAQRGNSSSSGRVAVKVGKGKKAYDTEYFPHVFDMKVVKEEAVNEVSKSTLASVATKRFTQAQAALKAGDFGGYVKGMNKSHKAADKTVPKSGWSPEDDGDTGVFGGPLPNKNLSKGQQKALDKVLPKREEVSPQEKYRQIKEAKLRARKGK